MIDCQQQVAGASVGLAATLLELASHLMQRIEL